MDRNRTLTLEGLEVDQLFVDEADLYKNLAYTTKMTRIAGLPKSDSKRVFGMFLKIRYLQEQKDGRQSRINVSRTRHKVFRAASLSSTTGIPLLMRRDRDCDSFPLRIPSWQTYIPGPRLPRIFYGTGKQRDRPGGVATRLLQAFPLSAPLYAAGLDSYGFVAEFFRSAPNNRSPIP